MDESQRARQISRTIEEALQLTESGRAGEAPVQEQLPPASFVVSKQSGCLACDPGACPRCGYLFTGEVIVIDHKTRGKRTLSDRAVHYLSHGIAHYQTGYIVHGEPVTVDLDLEELASYLDL
jgi:predicted Zn-ribbon and HTH transcriptional regulator